MDEVYLFYEKCLKVSLDTRRNDAIMLANCNAYTTPSTTNKGLQEKQRSWKNYINSLDWNYIMHKSSKSVNGLLNMFRGLSIPMKKAPSDSVKKEVRQ